MNKKIFVMVFALILSLSFSMVVFADEIEVDDVGINKLIQSRAYQQLKQNELPNGEYSISFDNGYELSYSYDKLNLIKKNNQYFDFKKLSDGYIVVSKDGFILSVDNTGKLILEKANGKTTQRWNVFENSQGFYLKNVYSDKSIYVNESFELKTNELINYISLNSEKPLEKGEFEYFSQKDDRWRKTKYSWGTVKNAGCGPTALTMIVNQMIEYKLEPPELYSLSKDNDLDILASPRTDMKALLKLVDEKYPVDYKIIEKHDVIQELKNGNEIMIMTKTNPLINYRSKGHYLVLKGFDKNGNIVVYDPYPMNTFDKEAGDDVHLYNETFQGKKFVYVTNTKNVLDKAEEIYSFWAE